jgi:amino acid adenylation domain-containing protein
MQLLFEFNETDSQYPKEKDVVKLFEEQVKKRMGKMVLVHKDNQLTYGGLNKKSNKLAHQLRQKGVRPDTIVGIIMERSVEMIIGILGILKAGGTYLPVDPGYPGERITYMLEDNSCPIVIIKGRRSEIRRNIGPCEIIDIEKPGLLQEEVEHLERTVTPKDLIYVIFTSGSTGRPKGAGVYHRGFMNLINWYIREFGLNSSDSTLLLTSLSFDLTQKNIFAPLAVGGTLHIPTVNYYDPPAILQGIWTKSLTWLNCTPGMFYKLIEEEDKLHKLSSLRYVFLGGEPISMAVFRKWFGSDYCNAEVVNTYGPTECSDVCSFYRIDRWGPDLSESVPIGKPIYNTQLYVLDPYLRLLPVGVPGELCISGDGVGLGYINFAQLKSEKFVSVSFGKAPAKVLYRTSDLTRWLLDGNIEFLGRIDNQVKIRGFRIELGELETQLLKHDKIKEAVVIALDSKVSERSNHGGGNGDKYLCAYIVFEGAFDKSSIKKEIREYLLSKLPGYMIPSYFVLLDKLPLNPNGKIDRKALQDPKKEDVHCEEYFAPRNELEIKLVEIWEKVLTRNPIGISENFFMIGGDSIKLIQIAARMKKQGYQFEMSDLFTHQSISELSPHIKYVKHVKEMDEIAGPDDKPGPESVPKDIFDRLTKKYSGEIEDMYPLTPMQEGMLFHVLYENSSSLFINQISYRLHDEIDLSVVEKSVNELIKRHDILRTVFVYGGYIEGVEKPLQLVLKTRRAKILYEDINKKIAFSNKEQFIKRFKLKDRQSPFDLSEDLLLRLAIIKLDKSGYEFIWTYHCILMDGWSRSIMILDFNEIYASNREGRKCQLAPVIPFENYIKWLEKRCKNESKKYWEKYLEGYEEVSSVPKMKASINKEAGFVLSHASVVLEDEKIAVLNNITRKNRVTLNILFQTIWGIILGKYTGKNDVVFGNIVSGRPPLLEGIETMVGLFTNMIPVRVRFDENTTFMELLREIQQDAFKSEPHHYYPLVEIQSACSLKQHLFDHFYVFQNFPGSDELQELINPDKEVEKEFISKLTLVEGFEQTSYDLTIYVVSKEVSGIILAYNANVYSRNFMEKTTLFIGEVIDKVIENANTRIKNIEITSDLSTIESTIFSASQPDFDF